MNTSHGLELTFIPRRPHSKWQEWKDPKEACKVTNQFNTLLFKSSPAILLSKILGTPIHNTIWGKADIFRATTVPGSDAVQPHNAYCLEVNNTPFGSDEMLNPYSHEYEVLAKVYSLAHSLGLRPHVSVKKRNGGTIIDYPNGGGHQHVQLDFWAEGHDYLVKLLFLERSLCIDYANNPSLRWLFSHWADNTNSSVAVNLKGMKEIENIVASAKPNLRSRWGKGPRDEYIHEVALRCHSIKQRMAYTGKPCRPTYEFRFLDMPRDMEELVLHTRFVSAWIGYYIEKIDGGKGGYLGEVCPKFSLTSKHYNRLTKDMGYARASLSAFLNKIGLKPENYLDAFFEEHYDRRMKYGQAL